MIINIFNVEYKKTIIKIKNEYWAMNLLEIINENFKKIMIINIFIEKYKKTIIKIKNEYWAMTLLEIINENKK